MVIFRDPRDPRVLLCKRVKRTPSDNSLWQHVPRGSVFVEGDNSADSTDSRSFGAIPVGLVLGIVTHKVGRASLSSLILSLSLPATLWLTCCSIPQS